MPAHETAGDTEMLQQAADIAARLQAVFNDIYRERMADVPIINDKLEVSAIGFQRWQDCWLGVLVTPWFMNLMLLPGETLDWSDKRELGTDTWTFPSGSYEFLTGYEPAIGKYQSCSLFSPMFDFADNAAAVETAEVVIEELMNPGNVETADIDSEQIENIWNGSAQHPDKKPPAETAPATKPVPISERMETPVSRRRLLRGAFMLDEPER